ncbi:hypothetical protein CBR_g19787 [Chara braunii]|uniref:Acyl-[acyl-carrier-protein] hydrolase n=1 Tax=Chara braunii TaxID=69332 RepID=A0A388JTZ1_CHABU|nr:hypothetical protein CBR_g19787 [Chara braunii]|eukprot:GBG61255.1 hypothetical protein CBR_g19787 [Chara braunii]
MQSCATQAVVGGRATLLAPICDEVGRSRQDAVLRRPDAAAGGTTPPQIGGAYARQSGSSSHDDRCGFDSHACRSGKLMRMPRGRVQLTCQRQVSTPQAARRILRLNHNAARRSDEVAAGGALMGGGLRERLAGSGFEMTSVVCGEAGTKALGGGGGEQQAVGLPPLGALPPPPTTLQRCIHCAPLVCAATTSGETSARDLLCPSFGRVARRLSPYGGSATFTRTRFPRNCASSEIAGSRSWTRAGSTRNPITCWSGSWYWQQQSGRGGRRLMSVGASSSSSAASSSPSPSPSPDERRRRRRAVEVEEDMEDDLFGFLVRMYGKVVAFLSKQGGELRQIEWPSASETQLLALSIGDLQSVFPQLLLWLDGCRSEILCGGPERRPCAGVKSELGCGSSGGRGAFMGDYLNCFPRSLSYRPVCAVRVGGETVRGGRGVLAAALCAEKSACGALRCGLPRSSQKASGRCQHVAKTATSGMQIGTEEARIHADEEMDTRVPGNLDFQKRRSNGEAVRPLDEEVVVEKDECVLVAAPDVDFPRPGGLVDGGLAYRETFLVRCYEVGVNRTASIETIANLLQEVGANHAQAAGFSADGFATTPAMREKRLIWVTTRMHIEMITYPLWGDVVVVETWFQQDGKVSVRRDWLLHDAGTGALVGRATSTWVMMNQDTRRLSKIPEEVKAELQVYCPSLRRHALSSKESGKKIGKIPEPADFRKSGLKVRRRDLDMNHHVNNVTYIGWMLESIPGHVHDEYELESATLEYRSECLHEDTITSLASAEGGDHSATDGTVRARAPECMPNGEGDAAAALGAGADEEGLNASTTEEKPSVQFIHVLVLQEDSKELSRGRTLWRKKVTRDFS